MNKLHILGIGLQNKGYFTQYNEVEGVQPWLDACKPNEDVMEDEMIKAIEELTTDAYEVIQIRGPEDRCWNHYVRIAEL